MIVKETNHMNVYREYVLKTKIKEWMESLNLEQKYTIIQSKEKIRNKTLKEYGMV